MDPGRMAMTPGGAGFSLVVGFLGAVIADCATPTRKLFPDALLADRYHADRFEDAIGGRHGKAALGHQLADQRRRLGPADRRLHADAHETVGVIDRLPRVAREDRHGGVGIAAAAVPSLELRAAVDEQLHDVVASLECGTDERPATLAVTVIRIESEVEQHPYGFQIVLRRSLVGDAFDPANASRRGQRGVAVLSR